LNIKEYLRPQTLKEANELLENAVVIGGGVFLHQSSRNIDCVLDLTKLNLDFIVEKEEAIEIGAMTTLREIEKSSLIKENFDGVLSKTAASIMGVQLRNAATLGGSVYGKYGFSDVLTTLLALDARVELYRKGNISLEDFLESKRDKDILMKVIIQKGNYRTSYQGFRNTNTDFSIINASAALKNNGVRICVGARPLVAKTAYCAMDYISKNEINEVSAIKAGEIAAEELDFGNDMRATAEYRRELCKILVKRCIMEVLF
jgi:CO/xanthine dehydrogenase FAD-binding subunit